MESITQHRTSTSWPAEVAVAALTGAVTAYFPVHRWSRGARWAMHGGMGAATAAGTAFLLRTRGSDGAHAGRDTDEEPLSVGAAAAVAVLLGTTLAAVSRGGEAADGWVERQLTAHGVRRPRLWIGVAAAGLSLAMSAADRRTAARRAETQIVPGSDGGGGEPGVGGSPGSGG